MTKSASEWFAVKGLFRWYFKDTGDTGKVEERVVLFGPRISTKRLNLPRKRGLLIAR